MQTFLDEILTQELEQTSRSRHRILPWPRRSRQQRSLPTAKPSAPGIRPRVVFVPGLMGSNLAMRQYDGGLDLIWPPLQQADSPKLHYLLTQGNGYDQGGSMVPAGPIGGYIRLYHEVLAKLRAETDLLEFSYDWRLSNAVIAKKMGDVIAAKWPDLAVPNSSASRVSIIAHSLGGLMARYFVEALGGHRFVKQLVGMGLPNMGAPSAFMGANQFSPIVKEFTLGSFASLMELLPMYDFVKHGEQSQPLPLTFEYIDNTLKKGPVKTPLQKFMAQKGWGTKDVVLKFRTGLFYDPVKLNTWLLSNNIDYHFVASNGLKTTSGFDLSSKEALFSWNGDGTVPLPSALWYPPESLEQSNIKRVKYQGIEHRKMFKSDIIQDYCLQRVKERVGGR